MNSILYPVIIALIASAFLSSCKQKRTESWEYSQQTRAMSEILVYNDSIGNVEESVVIVTNRIDSLYQKMYSDALKEGDEELMRSIENSKMTYKSLAVDNAIIFRRSLGNATSGGAAAALYEYYFYTRYYDQVLSIQMDLSNYFADQDLLKETQ